MEILLEPKFRLLSVTCVINLLCDLTPVYFYNFMYCHFPTHTTPCNTAAILTSNVSVSRTLQRQFPVSEMSSSGTHPYSPPVYTPFRYLLSSSFCPIWIICTFCIVLFASVGFSAFSMQPLLLLLWSLAVFLLLCAPWGQGLGLSDHWPPIRIRQMTGYQMVNVLE